MFDVLGLILLGRHLAQLNSVFMHHPPSLSLILLNTKNI